MAGRIISKECWYAPIFCRHLTACSGGWKVNALFLVYFLVLPYCLSHTACRFLKKRLLSDNRWSLGYRGAIVALESECMGVRS